MRLHAYQGVMETRSGTKVIFSASELDWFAQSYFSLKRMHIDFISPTLGIN